MCLVVKPPKDIIDNAQYKFSTKVKHNNRRLLTSMSKDLNGDSFQYQAFPKLMDAGVAQKN